jgi:hypothetical protein
MCSVHGQEKTERRNTSAMTVMFRRVQHLVPEYVTAIKSLYKTAKGGFQKEKTAMNFWYVLSLQ